MNRPAAVTLLTVITAFAVAALYAHGASAVVKPTVELTPASGSPGGSVKVRLYNWPGRIVTATVCGNAAKRGTQDCAVIGSQDEVVEVGAANFDLVLATPPMPCPCVVRVSTPRADDVVTVPIALDGIPNAPVISAAVQSAPEEQLQVEARVEPGGGGWASAFGGPTHRTLELTVHNHGSAAMSDVRVSAAVGRHRGSGEWIRSHTIHALAPGARRTIEVPIAMSAPTWGGYTVSGHVYWAGESVPFSAKTSTEPWALELLLPVVLLVWAQVIRRRDRARARVDDAGSEAPAGVLDLDLEQLSDSSPDVGDIEGVGSPTPPYAADGDLELVPTGSNRDFRGNESNIFPVST